MRSKALIIIHFLTSSCAYIEYTEQWMPSDGKSIISGYVHQPDELISLEPVKNTYIESEEIIGIYRFLFTNTYNDRHGYSLIQFFLYISG